jgi:dipeptidyl aminopeptidase/acylaminoacyl peptidase
MDGLFAPLQGRARRALLFTGLPAAAFAAVFVVTLVVSGNGGTRPLVAAESSPAPDRGPATLSGEGRLVLTLFAGGEELVAGYLASMALDGSGVRPITEPPAEDTIASDVAPSPSPDGGTIAFQRAVSGPDRSTEPHIYLVLLDGSGLRRLTRARPVELDPAWSPAGTTIAFARYTRGSFDLVACAPDGSGLTRLTETPAADEGFPAWSPDGSRIAFTRYENGLEGGSGDLWIMNADGTGATRLLGGAGNDSEPAWSPDGRRIAFVRNGDVAVMNADGSGVRELTSDGQGEDRRPRWNPDGSRIVFTRDPGHILAVAADGSGLAQLPLDGLADGAVWEREP